MAGKNLTITGLNIYPIKSCRGIALDHTVLTRQGLKHDRRWMFVDAANKFLTIRQRSQMTLIRTAINHDTQMLEVTLPRVQSGSDDREPSIEAADTAKPTFSVPLEPDEAYLSSDCRPLDVEIWEHGTDAWTYTAPAIVEPIQNFFRTLDPQSDVKFVMKGPTPRPAKGNGAREHLGRAVTVNFPDVLPVLVASEASLKELNSRLAHREEEAITIERFRPNIIVTSPDLHPWEEDEWRTLRLHPPSTTMGSLTSMFTPASVSGVIDIDVSARCARCQVPNVDPDTAVKHKREPWSVLYSYRRIDEGIKYKPCFGMLCCPRAEGSVAVGDTVQVTAVMEAAGGQGQHFYVKGF